LFSYSLSQKMLPDLIQFPLFEFRNNNFLQSKSFSPASNPQPGGPGHYIYIPQEQGASVILLNTG
jgi:hypothetical protein